MKGAALGEAEDQTGVSRSKRPPDTLWDVLRVYIETVFETYITIRDLEWRFARGERPLSEARAVANIVAGRAERFGLLLSAEYAKRMEKRYTDDLAEDQYATRHIERDFTELRSRFEDELKARLILYIPPERASYLNDALSGWPTVVGAYPEMAGDITEASKSLAVARYTASVFHLMRVMEFGVRRFASRCKATINTDRPWGAILNDVNGVIGKMPTKTKVQKNKHERYSRLYVHLDHVRLAWRNNTMHPKETYTEEEAIDVYGNVRAFMKNLSTIIK